MIGKTSGGLHSKAHFDKPLSGKKPKPSPEPEASTASVKAKAHATVPSKKSNKSSKASVANDSANARVLLQQTPRSNALNNKLNLKRYLNGKG